MDAIVDIFINYGYIGMFFAAFLSGSVLPFSSEAVMVGLAAVGTSHWQLLVWGTAGNVLGGVFNYGIGRFGKPEWIEKYLHVKPEKMQCALKFMENKGAWMGFFGFLPAVGEVVTVALGFMRSNIFITIISMTIGKAARYVLIIWGMDMLAG